MVSFSGLHVGDDLEASAEEQGSNVPVYAISDSTARSVEFVSGYGGLIVLSANIEGQEYTVYYGHINLESSNVKIGQAVKAGDILANLAGSCSPQADGERKHLHFSIRKGNEIDVRGYVQSEGELVEWINPKEFLTSKKATEK